MKKNRYLLILIVFTFIACEQHTEDTNLKTQNQTTAYTPPIKLTPGTDTIKLPTIINILPQGKASREDVSGPTTILIPTKPGGYYTKKKKDGTEEKINLLPPVINQMPVVSRNLKGEPLPDQSAAAAGMFTNYTSDNGLALDAVSCSMEDRWGNLWFGTFGGGVSKYDGKSFVNYTMSQGLASNNIWCITEDRIGNLWFGTSGRGVSKFDGQSFTNYSTEHGLAGNDVLSVIEDKDANLWFGSFGGGVSKYDGKSFTNFTIEQGLANNVVKCITKDKAGNLWFGTSGGGISKYNGKFFKNYTTAQGLVNNTIKSISLDKSGNLWFGTSGGGVSKYDGQSFTNYSIANGLVNNTVLSIAQDQKGDLWFGTSGGVSKYDGQSFTNYTTVQGLSNNGVCSITEDKTGNLWFGTYGGGVTKYSGKAFINYTTAQGLARSMIWSVTEDKSGNLWFATHGGGICKYDGKSFTNYAVAQGLANNIGRCVIEDRKGNIWCGTSGDGVSKYDGKCFTNYTTAQGLANNVVINITEDKTGNLWFATHGGGVSKYDGKSFTNYTTSQGLAHNDVLNIAEDKAGNLWFGTEGGGVSKYDGKSFTNYTTAQGLANNIIWTITEDREGILWFGTSGGGISRFDGKSFMNFTTLDGMPDDIVTQIVVSKRSNIVIATNYGVGMVVAFRPKPETKNQANIPAINNLNNEQLRNYKPVVKMYNSAKGFPVKDINTGQNAMFKDSKGIIWMATGANETGLVRFDEDALLENIKPPAVVINKIKVNGEDICWYSISDKTDSTILAQQETITFKKMLSGKERDTLRQRFSGMRFDSITKFYPIPQQLVLPNEHNNVTLEFNAIETSRNSLVRYQYILEGYNKDWSPITDKDNATFGNIYEGTYTFKLKAMSPEGVWSDPNTYTFEVLPPWWRTWWMYTLYTIGAIGVVFLIVWLNGKRLRERANELVIEVNKATIEIVKQKNVVEEQKKVVEEKHKEITDSINYAERIQRSLLASKELLDENLKEYFVFFQPKDVVSGDFYWAGILNNNHFALLTADSTGHGVPGAIMSILNISCLEKAVDAQKLVEPGDILNYTRLKIIETLKKDGSAEGGKDGMDCSLLSFDFQNNKLTCAAANNPVWIVRDKQLTVCAPNKMPVGKHDNDTTSFTQHTFELQKGDVVYTLTDGMSDQFGGPNGKKFMSKQLKELLISISDLPMQEQKEKLYSALTSWKGSLEQVDDICVIGVRV